MAAAVSSVLWLLWTASDVIVEPGTVFIELVAGKGASAKSRGEIAVIFSFLCKIEFLLLFFLWIGKLSIITRVVLLSFNGFSKTEKS